MTQARVYLKSVTINHSELDAQVSPILRRVRTRIVGRIIQTARFETTPVRTGHLRSTIDKAPNFDGPLTALGGVTAHARYAAPVHQGSKAHIIRARRAPMLRFYWEKVGHTVYFKSVRHPGTKANPFLMRAALRATATDPYITVDPA